MPASFPICYAERFFSSVVWSHVSLRFCARDSFFDWRVGWAGYGSKAIKGYGLLCGEREVAYEKLWMVVSADLSQL